MGIEHGDVLNLAGQQLFAFCRISESRSPDGQVVGLGSAAGKDDALRTLRSYQLRHPRPGLFQGSFGRQSPGVQSGGIAEVFARKAPGELLHPGIDRTAGLMVEINSAHIPLQAYD